MSKVKRETSIIGWKEWVSLPLLGLPIIKAKIDTGARTSALHATDMEVFEKEGVRWIRFKVLPLQGVTTKIVNCEAELLERRIVSDSGGHKEERYVIKTALSMGGIRKSIEITLTDRSSMKYRMLIGRSAISRYYIDPTQAYLLGKSTKQKELLKEQILEQDE